MTDLSRTRRPARRPRLAWEIVAALLGMLLGTVLSFAVAPAHAAPPRIAAVRSHDAPPAVTGDDADDDPEPVIEPALLTITGAAPIPAPEPARLRMPPVRPAAPHAA